LFSLPRRLLRSTPSLRRDFEQAVYSAATPGELRRSRFLAAATSLFLSLVERSGSAKPRTRLSSLLAWLEAHPDTQASVAELARRMGLSAPRLHAIFREEMGMAPHEYLLRLKVRRGAEMLAHSDHSVTRIAHELGFLSSQYFSTVFRRYEGMTPSDWRKASLSAAAPE
jgi:AraC-like DNA-binding protein